MNEIKMNKYLPFKKAQEFVRVLNLKKMKDWYEYCNGNNFPNNIPKAPHAYYKEKGWVSYGDWLGTGKVANQHREFLPFKEAKSLIQSFNFKSEREWKNFNKTNNTLDKIPSTPAVIYKDEGWVSMGDFLGHGRISNSKISFISFNEARLFACGLKLKNSKDWFNYCKSGNKPDSIPAAPQQTYKNIGWVSWRDFLGNKKIKTLNRKYLPFEEARAFVHNLKFDRINKWYIYCKLGDKPDNIPSKPERVYKNSGWLSFCDWIGNRRIANQNREYLQFEEARAFVHTLNLKNQSEWLNYCKSDNKSDNIPQAPWNIYENSGWLSLGDWLGTKIGFKGFLSFEEARAFVHTLNIETTNDWENYCKFGKKPDNIPNAPRYTYKNKGWVSMGNWLGTGSVADQYKEYLPFEEARAFVRSLNLKSNKEWREYVKSGKKPDNIPATPEKIY